MSSSRTGTVPKSDPTYTINVTDVDYVEFEHFPKKMEQTKIKEQIAIIEKNLLINPFDEQMAAQLMICSPD